MCQPNNPAGRLLQLVKSMKAIPDTTKDSKGKNRNTTAENAWHILLDVPEQDSPQLLSRLSRVMKLPEVAKTAVEDLSVDHELFLKWVRPVSKALMLVNLNTVWPEVKARIPDIAINTLEFCDHELSKNAPEKIVEKEKIDELLTEVRSLLDEIMKNHDLPHPLAKFMIERLILLEDALIDYQFFGIRSMQRTIESTVGAVAMDEEMYYKTKDFTYGQKFWNTMGRTATLLTLADTGRKLIGSDWVANLLTQAN